MIREMNLASVWERVADLQGDALALHHGGVDRTWSEYDDRAARFGAALAHHGVGVGNNVALALYNGNEYLEAQFGAFKVRAAPCNVNYRYTPSELRYLVDNSDSAAVVFDAALADRFDQIVGSLPDVRLWVQVGRGPVPSWATEWETLLAGVDPAARIDRSGDDLWILYTGGTTGHPKGVMWPHEHLVALCGRTFDALKVTVPERLDDVAPAVSAIAAMRKTPRQLAASPLMHGTANIGSLMTHTAGGAVVTLTGRSFDAAELWRLAESTSCTTMSIVGDVFGRPMVDELDAREGRGEPVDLSALRNITSSGVMWSQPIKDRLLAHSLRQGGRLSLFDSLGSSEGVGFGGKTSKPGDDTTTARFTLGPNAAVFTDDGVRVEPGSGERGLLAVGGPIPVGYYGDPAKSAETFREIGGRRWSIPGDWATVDADGEITLLGRGSVSINTGGEKVYPEEVEEALKLLDAVTDATVVGVPDPQWGAAVTAVISLADPSVSDADLLDQLRRSLAGYKVPKRFVRVDRVFRSPNGKADYRWATETAEAAITS